MRISSSEKGDGAVGDDVSKRVGGAARQAHAVGGECRRQAGIPGRPGQPSQAKTPAATSWSTEIFPRTVVSSNTVYIASMAWKVYPVRWPRRGRSARRGWVKGGPGVGEFEAYSGADWGRPGGSDNGPRDRALGLSVRVSERLRSIAGPDRRVTAGWPDDRGGSGPAERRGVLHPEIGREVHIDFGQ